MSDARKFVIVRILIAAYLVNYWLAIFPYRDLLYLDPLSPKRRVPLIDHWLGQLSSGSIAFALGAAIVSSIGLCFARTQRVSAVAAYGCLLFLIHGNGLLHEVSTQYVGWSLVMFALLPGLKWQYKSDSERAFAEDWARRATSVALIAIGGAYSFMGFKKIIYEPWYSENLIPYLFMLSHKAGLRSGLFAPSPLLHYPLALAAALAELLALPLLLWRRTHHLILVLLTGLQLFIFIVMGFYYIASFMLITHLMALQSWPLRRARS